jgi:hypothetical protein
MIDRHGAIAFMRCVTSFGGLIPASAASCCAESDHELLGADFRSIGIHVFRRRFDNSSISGVYVKHPVAGSCVLVNYSEDIYRQRFTAAHQAAHAISDQDEEVIVSFVLANNDLREVRANTFAPSFLSRSSRGPRTGKPLRRNLTPSC